MKRKENTKVREDSNSMIGTMGEMAMMGSIRISRSNNILPLREAVDKATTLVEEAESLTSSLMVSRSTINEVRLESSNRTRMYVFRNL